MQTALISVSDKSGLVEFARNLVKLNFQLISTGGTARELKKNKIPVREIAELTSFPEILGGRVKTLHPKILGGILARENSEDYKTLQSQQIPKINLVCVNLYPFAQTIQKKKCSTAQAIEQIDIGGVALLRAAAKNFARVIVVSTPNDYPEILTKLKKRKLNLTERRKLAARAFQKTCQYDALITDFLKNATPTKNPGLGLPQTLPKKFNFIPAGKLRYGENPHQQAQFFREASNHFANIANAKILAGKALSFNNLVDADTAFRLPADFKLPTAAIIKHTNPCGVASAATIELALTCALKADLKSPFGGIVALNRPATKKIATILQPLFLEIVIAPSFTPEALKIFRTKKNLRLLATGTGKPDTQEIDFKKIGGGLLFQDYDHRRVVKKDCRIVSARLPTSHQLQDLLFAANVCRHAKSNAIVIARDLATVGIGTGQTARVDAVEIALAKAGTRASGSSLASDAFFPFADSVEVAARAGITALIEPGGSIRDPEVIAAADRANLILVFSGVRGFRH